MAFTIKQFNDLRGILLLMLITIPSIATTNIDCNGKPFRCVNSTHFMICVYLGGGVSETIDSYIIPCPEPTECHNTNRFECEYPAATTQLSTNEPVVITTDQPAIATFQANESTVQFVPEILTTVPFEDLYNTVSTTTLSGSELSSPNPTFITDTTIDVFNTVNTSTSGSHADLEVGGKNTEVQYTTSPTLVFSETTVSTAMTDFAVASTTDIAIIFTQTDSNINTINNITTVNLDVGITTTEQNKLPTFTTTEGGNLINENKTEIKSISEKQLVTENINVISLIQNEAAYTTESLQVKNNDVSIKIPLDQLITTNDQDQLRTDNMAKETTVTVTNPLDNVLINNENTTTMLTDVPKDHTDAIIKQKTQIYATETLIASSIIPSDLSVPTESIILVEPNTLTDNKVLVDQEKTLFSENTGTLEKTLRLIPETNIEMSTQDATADYNLGNVVTEIINNSEVITGPSSELHNAVISSTAPTIDTTLIAETTFTQDAFYSIKTTSEISTSESNGMTEKVMTYDNNNNIVDNITTVSLPSTDSPTLTTDNTTPPTAPKIDTILIAETTITQDAFYSIKTESEVFTSEANVMTVENITTVFLPSTDSPTLTTDEKIVSTEPSDYLYIQNETVVNSLGTNLKSLSDNSTVVTTEKEFNPTVTKPAVSESNINVVTQPSKLDPALQQLEVSNKPDSDTNVSNLNTQHNILSNLDLNADNIKTETTITEPIFTETEKNIGNRDVNTRIQLVEHYTVIPQPENEKPRIHTTESSNDIVSDSNIIFEPSSLPFLPTESFLYLEAHTPEKSTKGQVIIESKSADVNQLNSENKNKIDLITNAESSILSTKATAQYYDVTESIRKSDQLNTVSETNTITDTTNEKAPDFTLNKTISELRKNEPTGHEISSNAQNELQTNQLQERVEIKTLQKTATETIHYSPTVAADGKLVGTESTFFENEQYKIKPTVVDTMASENQLILATTESILELNPTITDSAVSESNLFFESSVNAQLPKALLTKTIDIINNHDLKALEIGSEKSNKVEAKGYETPKAPLTETQTQLREIEFNTKQQKETKTISSVAPNIAEYDTISKFPVTESIRNIIDFNVPSRTISSDSILQLTTSSVLEKTEEIISESKVFESNKDSTKSIISPGFIKIKNGDTKYYSKGDLTTRSIPTISMSGNLGNKVQDHAYQTIATPLNLIITPIVNSLETMQYNQNVKSSEGLTTLQTPIEQMTTEFKFGSKNNIENINKKSQDIAPNIKNIVANIVNNLVPINLNKLSFKTENVNGPKNQEISVPILEKAVINLTPSSTTEKQDIVPEEFHATTHNTVYTNHEAALSESVSNNIKDVIIGTTNNELPLSELPSIGDLSIQNTYIDKHLIIKHEDLHTKESVPKELNIGVVNEEMRTTADIINHTSTSYNDTRSNIIPAVFPRRNELINKSLGEFNNKSSIDNISNLVGFNESDSSGLTLIVENINQDFTVANDTILSEADIQTRNKLEGHSIVELVKTAPILTSDILKIMQVTVNKTFTPVPNIFNSEKDQTLNTEAVVSATETLKSLQTVSGDNNVSKVSETEKNNGTENTHSSIFSSKDGFQKNVKIAPEARVKSLAERDVSTTSNKLSTIQVESKSYSQKVNNNAGEAVNLAPFDLLSSAKSGGFEENNNKPSTEKPDDEETIAIGNEGENRKINKESSLTTLSSENASVTTESVEVDNNGNNNNNIVQSNSKYETLTSKPTIETSTRPTQDDNLKNIHLPIVSEVSTQSTVRSTSQKLSLENNTPLPATTKAVTNDFICLFNQRGRFADKHDCRKFYICHGIPQPLVGICPVYTVFSELRKQCTKNLSHCVRNNQFQCMSEGRFSDFLNDSIYYICAKNKLSTFIRFKLRCQNGYHLNKTSVRCVLNTQTSQSISSDISKSNSEQSAALKVEVTSKDSSKKKLECKKEGAFADPDNCRVYYVCKKTSKSGYLRKKKKCDSDEYFHKDKKKCVDAESYECK